MAAGASSLDPLEPLFDALDRVGAQIVKHGVPAHPGSLFWLAYLGTVPIFGLSSCEMFSHKTILDLILPRLLAGERVGREELIEMGHGGLLARYMAFRFPPYGD
jgi:molybdopterin biosynthesis enzyme